MKFRTLLMSSLLLVAPFVVPAAETKPAEKSAAVTRHPLRGVITSVMPEQSAFMVKHEEIPGVMHAMTMMFKVDDATLKAFKAGDAITGLMWRQGRNWLLENVKPAAAKPAK